jgi:hypothetical protein
LLSQPNTAAAERGGFDRLLEETIRSSVTDLLGESSMRAIVFHLGMERLGDEQVFDQKLREFLKEPASIIEEMIVKDLFKRLDLLYSPRGPFDFVRYARAAREFYTSQAKRRAG